MSRLNNEGVTKASFGILGALKEAENLQVKKQVLSNGVEAVETRTLKEEAEVCPKCHKEECECEEKEVVEESVEPTETPEGSDVKVPGEGKEPLAEEDEKPEDEVEERPEDEIEERVCESLEILDIAGSKVLLKESAGFIVGKNYNKSTGIIEEAEIYKTEKIARKAFDRLK